LQTPVCKTLYENMTNSIKHSGIVESVEDGCVKVKIVQTSACSSCKIAGHCSASESKDKIVEVYDKTLDGLKVGDSVVVIASQRTGMLSVLLSSVIPLVILVAVLFFMIELTENEVLSALTSIGALIPYYLVLYLMRDKIRSKLSFGIETVR